MLQIETPSLELYDSAKNEFTVIRGKTLSLEHSLISLAKWESIWHKPFLEQKELAGDEFVSYVECMTIGQPAQKEIYYSLSQENVDQINKYISDPMTATWFSRNDNQSPKGHEIVTAELLYCQMFMLNIPMECEKWHINRLITLIRVCSIKSTPAKKMSKSETLAQQARLNQKRRAEYAARQKEVSNARH